MWSKSVEIFNPYEALMKAKLNPAQKEVSRFRWLFMSKWQKLMYSIPVCHRNKQRLHLGNGYVLDFETMTIEVDA